MKCIKVSKRKNNEIPWVFWQVSPELKIGIRVFRSIKILYPNRPESGGQNFGRSNLGLNLQKRSAFAPEEKHEGFEKERITMCQLCTFE
jgi:hypothetical protein